MFHVPSQTLIWYIFQCESSLIFWNLLLLYVCFLCCIANQDSMLVFGTRILWWRKTVMVDWLQHILCVIWYYAYMCHFFLLYSALVPKEDKNAHGKLLDHRTSSPCMLGFYCSLLSYNITAWLLMKLHVNIRRCINLNVFLISLIHFVINQLPIILDTSRTYKPIPMPNLMQSICKMLANSIIFVHILIAQTYIGHLLSATSIIYATVFAIY